MEMGLEGKVAIVTGGSEGIGKAAAERMAGEGANVIIVARRQEILDAAADEIRTATEGEVLPLSADVTEKGTAARVVNTAVERYGRLDILVNNAGTSMAKGFENVSDDDWGLDFELKVWGAVNMRYDAPSTLPRELAVVEICNDDLTPPAEAARAEASSRSVPSPPSRRTAPNPAARQGGTESGDLPGPASPPPSQGDRPRTAPARPQTGAVVNESPSVPVSSDGDMAGMWQATVKALGRATGKRYNLGALLRDCKPNTITLEGDTLLIPFVHRPNMERMQEELEDPGSRNLVTEAVTRFFGTPYNFRITLAGQTEEGAPSNRPNQHSPLVRTALNMGARIVEDTIE